MYDGYQQAILKKLQELGHILNGCIGRILIRKSCTKLTSLYITPMNSTPYLAGPKAREFKKTEIDNILLMDVIKQPQW